MSSLLGWAATLEAVGRAGRPVAIAEVNGGVFLSISLPIVALVSNSDLATAPAGFGVPAGVFSLDGAVLGGFSLDALLGVGVGEALAAAAAGSGVADLLTDAAAATLLSSLDALEPARDRGGVLGAGVSLVGVGCAVTGTLDDTAAVDELPGPAGFSGRPLRSARSLL